MAGEKFEFAIDRGGTFTDVYARCPGGKIRLVKLLSQDPTSYPDAPREAIRRVIEEETGVKIGRDEPIDPAHISWIRMGTTVATNALLERKGEKFALVVTEGFKDVLYIGNQSRPNIFDLSCRCPEMLYTEVVEVEERVVLSQAKCQMEKPVNLKVVKARTGDDIEIWERVNVEKLKKDLKLVLGRGIKSVAVVLLHSYAYPDHEILVGKIAQEVGFENVTISSQVTPMVKMVPRGLTTSVDAYLTPHIQRYIKGFAAGFKGGLESLNVLFMQSDGGLTPVENFNGSRAILSGPAGGVVGFARTTFSELGGDQPVIGFDMGGTSTDVSRYDGTFEHTFEAITAGITIQSPQLDISTVAAGGGSQLFFRSGLYVVGPESAGAYPGPVCYRNGGPLTVTDANLCLGRVLPKYFPKIFGPNKNEGLDVQATRKKFTELAETINSDVSVTVPLTCEEVALGFIRVANEAMCRPIRAITEGKGYDSANHVLACFGGAGGQHACAIAQSLGIKTIFVHRYSGILSAYGMALADIVHEVQEPASSSLDESKFNFIEGRVTYLKEKCLRVLLEQKHEQEQITFEVYLNLRYDKTDFAIMTQSDIENGDSKSLLSFRTAFSKRYEREFGFTLSDRTIHIDDIRVRAIAQSKVTVLNEISSSSQDPEASDVVDCYFELSGHKRTPVYMLASLAAGHQISGPAIITDANSTLLIEPNCTAYITKQGNVRIEVGTTKARLAKGVALDSIQLSIFSHRFMSIAEQMGRVLQRTAISTNIKERLDFSCALFGPDGGLVSNAPHIPVHLGAMQKAVQFQMEHLNGDIKPGDVLLSNHPCAGGSHLPDLTVITPVFYDNAAKPVFFVASRGHHADIGGITPGSMPPHSTRLDQEGAAFVSFKLVKEGTFQESLLIEQLMAPAKVEGSTGSRCLNDCISDLQAQIAANNKGIKLVSQLIDHYGLDVVQAYMLYIQANAELAVRDMLKQICGQKEKRKSLVAEDVMDDGTVIKLRVDINGESGDAIFDFTGTGLEVHGNCNAPEAVTLSAIIYCLRCMVGHDVPLNQGCLAPIQVIIPKGSVISPSPEAGVVGGNVLTSQRVVDVVLRAFEACAASQGCMNNITFGDEDWGYYETVAGGSGAGPSWDGRSAIHTHMTNTRITDAEIIEKRYPVLVRKFHILEETGGSGLHPGGNGLVRELTFRKNLVLSVLTERRVFAPYGLKGGHDGKRGRNVLTYASGRAVNLGAKTSVTVAAGDTFELQTPGGGGFGVNM
ncbi:5-oxoprolinase [Halotydeus destructor]|nr:5-oxoprolinase [Halotydeus destructor]